MVQPTTHLGSMAQPIVPGLQTHIVLNIVGSCNTIVFVCLNIAKHRKGTVKNTIKYEKKYKRYKWYTCLGHLP